jgi:hypothetical protein
MGKAQPLEDLLKELAIYEATVSSWSTPESLVDTVVIENQS